MLPPELREVKRRLTAKGYSNRTSAEDRLLAELQVLDEVLDSDVIELSRVAKKSAQMPQIVSGPGDACPCCGRM